MAVNLTAHPNGIAPLPAGNYRFGAKGGRMAQAWQFVWDRLDRATWVSGQELADKAAAAFDLKPVSVTEMLSRMRGTGVLEQKMVPLLTEYLRYGKPYVAYRPRVHYRIAAR